jgi:hypothetical protein
LIKISEEVVKKRKKTKNKKKKKFDPFFNLNRTSLTGVGLAQKHERSWSSGAPQRRAPGVAPQHVERHHQRGAGTRNGQ